MANPLIRLHRERRRALAYFLAFLLAAVAVHFLRGVLPGVPVDARGSAPPATVADNDR